MKKMAFFLAVILAMSSCVTDWNHNGNNTETTTKIVKTDSFDRIELMTSVNVVYRQGDSLTVTLTGPEKLLDKIVVKVVNGQLRIADKASWHFGFNSGLSFDDVSVAISSSDLIDVSLVGSGDLTTKGLIDTDLLNVSLRGSGDMAFDTIVCDKIKAELIGSGDLKLGKIQTQAANISLVGSGDLSGSLSQTRQTLLNLLGSGDIDIHFANCQEAKCKLLGSGDMNLSGRLDHIDRQKDGSGDIDTDKLTLKK